MASTTGVDENLNFSANANQSGQPSESLAEAQAKARAWLPGSIIIRRAPRAEDHLRLALAVVLPPAAGARRDNVTIGELSNDQHLNQGKLSIRNITFATLSKEFNILVPHAFMARPGAEALGCGRIAVTDGMATHTAVVAHADVQREIVTMKVWRADGGEGNVQTTLAGMLEITNVAETGGRNMLNTEFKKLEETITSHPSIAGMRVKEPGSEPSVRPGGISLLMPRPPPPPGLQGPAPGVQGPAPGGAAAPAAHPPPPPPPPQGPDNAAPAAHAAPPGMQARAAPPAGGFVLDLSGGTGDRVPARFVRLILSNLPGFINHTPGDWAGVPETAIRAPIGAMLHRLRRDEPFESMEQAEAFIRRADATIQLIWQEDVLAMAGLASSTVQERSDLLRPHSRSNRTPQQQPEQQERRPPHQTGARGAGGRGGGGEAGRSLDGLFGSVDMGGGTAREGDAGEASPGDSDSSDEEDRRPKAKKAKRGASDSDYPTLMMLAPDAISIRTFAEKLQEAAAGKASATAAIVDAVKQAGNDAPISWGDDPREAAEAAMATALEIIKAAGGEIPTKPATADAEGLSKLINKILKALRKTRNGESDGARTREPGREGRMLSMSAMANNRPADDFERGICRTAPVGPSVMERLSQQGRPTEARVEWERRAREAGVGMIVTGAPNDIIRIILADKFSRVDSESMLPTNTREAIMATIPAREAAAKAAIDRALRAQLAPDIMKKLTATVMTLSFSKMPTLKQISDPANITDSFGTQRKMGACHPAQAMAAIRAAVAAAFPEIDMGPLLAVEDDVRGLLLGKTEGGVTDGAAVVRAAQLLEMSTKAFEARVSAFRQGTLFGGDEPINDMFAAEATKANLDKQHDAATAAMGLLAALTRGNDSNLMSGITRGSGPHAGGGKARLNTLLTEWRGEFGSQACIYHWARGSCDKGAACDKQHEAAGISATAVKEWAAKHNADTAPKVSTPQPPPALATQGLALAAFLFGESPLTNASNSSGAGAESESSGDGGARAGRVAVELEMAAGPEAMESQGEERGGGMSPMHVTAAQQLSIEIGTDATDGTPNGRGTPGAAEAIDQLEREPEQREPASADVPVEDAQVSGEAAGEEARKRVQECIGPNGRRPWGGIVCGGEQPPEREDEEEQQCWTCQEPQWGGECKCPTKCPMCAQSTEECVCAESSPVSSCGECKRLGRKVAVGGAPGGREPTITKCGRCGWMRCELCNEPGTPPCRCPPAETLQVRAVAALRMEPEGAAIERAELSMRTEKGAIDTMRMQPEMEYITRLMPTQSLDDRPVRKPAQEHRCVRERKRIIARGMDPDWRPPGDATTLFKAGYENSIEEIQQWRAQSHAATGRMVRGEEVNPPPELYQNTEQRMLEQAAALMPWWIQGDYYKNPVPMFVLFTERGESEFSVDADYYKRRRLAGDPDADICFQVESYGLDALFEVKDTHLVYMLPTFWADPEILRISIEAVEKEKELGIFKVYKGQATYPARQMPRMAIDEGMRANGTRKIRSVVHYSFPKPVNGVHRYPGGHTNASIDLSDPETEIRMTSGIKHHRSTGVLSTSGLPVLQWKGDGKNAYRQLLTAMIDTWALQQAWPSNMRAVLDEGAEPEGDDSLLDGATIMGLASAMRQFQRAMEVPNRHVNQLERDFDERHPPEDEGLKEWLEDRIQALGKQVGSRQGTDGQFCDDSIRAAIDYLVKLKHGIPCLREGEGAEDEPAWSQGDWVHSAEAKRRIFDNVFEGDLKMRMADEKRMATYGWMEVLGVDGSPTEGKMRYPLRKRQPLKDAIEKLLVTEGTVSQDDVHTVVSTEGWVSQVAPELCSKMSTAWAAASAKVPGGRVRLSAECRADQRFIAQLLDTPLELPLVPRSTYPPMDDFHHAITAMDASTSRGAGGWLLMGGKLYVVRVVWAQIILTAFKDGRWSVSPAELWIELILILVATERLVWPKDTMVLFITALTDNESARAAANRGTSGAPTMRAMARRLAQATSRPDRVVRTMRVTTKENKTADDLSRAGGERAGRELAKRLGVEYVERDVEADDPVWGYIVIQSEPPSSPSNPTRAA